MFDVSGHGSVCLQGFSFLKLVLTSVARVSLSSGTSTSELVVGVTVFIAVALWLSWAKISGTI